MVGLNNSPQTITCDLFCQVVDNLGDAGVSWRLAKQLYEEYGWQVRFWIDKPQVLEQILFQVPTASGQKNIHVFEWNKDKIPAGFPADVVITTFCAALSDAMLDLIKQKEITTKWIHVEYFSAEKWVDDFNGLTKIDPKRGVHCHVLFPGLSTKSAGVLRERSLTLPVLNREDKAHQKIFWFTYEHPYEKEWFLALSKKIKNRYSFEIHKPSLTLKEKKQIALTHENSYIEVPFVAQDQFDSLLSTYHFAWVRGEDSVMRALLKGIPFVWHIYPQSEGAHWPKLAAFFDCVFSSLSKEPKQALWQIWKKWNNHQSPPENLAEQLNEHRAVWQEAQLEFLKKLWQQDDLAKQISMYINKKTE